MDLISGDRSGYLNVFVRNGGQLTAYYQYKLMDSTPLNVGANSQPTVADWDGDGRKDLLIGTETGYIRFYHNFGTDSWPAFQTFENVSAAGAPIYLYRVNPVVYDLDRDSVPDIICGSNDGYVRFYRNIGTRQMPQLAAEETLRYVNGTPIVPIGSYAYGSRVGFGDWNNDGLPDFLMSGYEGYVQLHRGLPVTGFAESPRTLPVRDFIGQSLLAAPGLPARIRTPDRARVTLCDAAGRPVARLTGSDHVVWDGGICPAGVYYCRLDEPSLVLARIVLAR